MRPGAALDDVRLIVPPLDEEPWPTLGPEVCDWIEAHLVFGPGDLLGQAARLSPEERLLIYRAYEVYPRDHRLAGRRRFKRVFYSRRKGMAKTEKAAWIAIAEMDPTAPVRCDGWRVVRGEWVPTGRSVTDPRIFMAATTEEQTEDLAYSAAYEILLHCPLGDEYDVGLERIAHKTGGRMDAVASAPSARDGSRTTFQHFDEPHLFIAERLKRAHATMLRNIPKRRAADAWSFETSTMYGPGEGSVAEEAHLYALAILRGEVDDPRLLFDHRQASERHNIATERGLREAILEASGDAASWTDVDSIIALSRDPSTEENEFRRYWLNQRRKTAQRWMPLDLWAKRADTKRTVAEGARVVLAFDGAYSRDSTALVGCTVEAKPHVFIVRAWERPLTGAANWRTPRREVESEVAKAMERYEVVELAPDPPGWHREIEDWEEAYGEVVVRFETNQPSRMGPACDEFVQAVKDDDFTQDGSEVLRRHIGNCVPVDRRGYTVVTKSAPDSPDKIDCAVGAIVAKHRARWHHVHGEDELVAVVIDPKEKP